MKVLMITDLCRGFSVTLPERNLFRGLAAKGVDLTVITHWKTPESEEVELSGIKVIYIPIVKKIDLRVIRTLRRLIKEDKYDILHMTFGKAITNGLLASWRTGIKIVAYLGSLNVHWHDPFAYLSFLNPFIDRLICLSDGVMEHFLKQAGKRMKNKTVRIYKGYDTEWVKVKNPVQKESLGIPDNTMIICCVAIVRKVKGIPYLIRAADFLPDNLPVYFILVGLGMDSGPLKKLINKSKYSSNFRTFGFTNEVFSYISLCDLYIQPSVTEGLGRSLVEAMCLKKPVIVTERGGSRELVNEGINGYIVRAKSPSAIAEKITLCFSQRDILPGMGLKSYQKIVEDFNPQTMIDKTLKVYEDLLSENSRSE
jgi:glycosyltransferase involved in cell wall biosynthesis